MMLRCECPRDDLAECGRPAEWSTDDLGDVHHLCEECCLDTRNWNEFRIEAAS